VYVSGGRAAQRPHERVDVTLSVLLAAVGDGSDHRALALQEGGDRLVDRASCKQVGRIDRVLLTEAVTAVLGLIVLGGRPVELEESDVRGSRQRDAMARDLDR